MINLLLKVEDFAIVAGEQLGASVWDEKRMLALNALLHCVFPVRDHRAQLSTSRSTRFDFCQRVIIIFILLHHSQSFIAHVLARVAEDQLTFVSLEDGLLFFTGRLASLFVCLWEAFDVLDRDEAVLFGRVWNALDKLLFARPGHRDTLKALVLLSEEPLNYLFRVCIET